MKVILLETIDRLGKIGEVVSVKDGFARNFLIPHNKAREATSGNMKMLDILKKKETALEKDKLDKATGLAAKMSALSLTIAANAGEEEKLFGSISNEMISEALAEEGIAVDKKDIILDEPIKTLGAFQVVVKLHPEVKANLRVWVVKK
jgi:large subunit ribosomal protein L9